MANTKWIIDPAHSEISFKAKHLMITHVSGEFDEFNSELETDGENFETGKLSFVAKVSSVNTGNEQRDTHLKSDDFFNAEKFPDLKFEASGLKKNGNGGYELAGNLTIRDITKPVKLHVEPAGIVKDPWGQTKAGFSVEGKISRKEFGLKWNALTEAGGAVVGDDIRILAEVQYVKQ